MATSGGYSSDTGARTSKRRLQDAAVLTFDFEAGTTALYHPGTEKQLEQAKKAGKYKVIAAEDLAQVSLRDADELSGHVVVRFEDVSNNLDFPELDPTVFFCRNGRR